MLSRNSPSFAFLVILLRVFALKKAPQTHHHPHTFTYTFTNTPTPSISEGLIGACGLARDSTQRREEEFKGREGKRGPADLTSCTPQLRPPRSPFGLTVLQPLT